MTKKFQHSIIAAIVALTAAAPVFADSAGLAQVYRESKVPFGRHADDREEFKGFLADISQASQGALSFQAEDSTRRRQFFGITTGSDLELKISTSIMTPEAGPLPGQTMVQQSVEHGLAFSDLVKSQESRNGRNDPAVKKCDDTAKRLRAMSRRDELKVEAECKVSEIRIKKQIQDPDREIQVEVQDASRIELRSKQGRSIKQSSLIVDKAAYMSAVTYHDKVEVKDRKGNVVGYALKDRVESVLVPAVTHTEELTIPGAITIEKVVIPGKKYKVTQIKAGDFHDVDMISHKVDLSYKFIPEHKLSLPAVTPVVDTGDRDGGKACDRTSKADPKGDYTNDSNGQSSNPYNNGSNGQSSNPYNNGSNGQTAQEGN